MNVISIDVGFGDSKIATSVNGSTNFFKDTNAIIKLGPKTEDNKHSSSEKNIVDFKNEYYLVGKVALQYPDDSIINVLDFDSMKLISPLIIKKYLTEDYDKITISLSAAYKDRSEEYKDYICNALSLNPENVKVLPQGAGCKVALDNIGINLKDASHKVNYQNYLIMDIGFNTIDCSTVIDGHLMPEDIGGYPEEGVISIARYVQLQLKTELNVDVSLTRVRSILYDKKLKVRDKVYDCTQYIKDGTIKYIEKLHNFLETRYKDRLNAIDNVILFGGGAELIRIYEDQWSEYYGNKFMLIPEVSAEYYNALGGLFIHK